MKVEDVITAWDTDDNVSDEGTNDGVARAPEQQNANSTYDSSPREFISENSSDKEETNKTSFRPGLLVSSTIMKKKKKKTIWKRAPAFVNVFAAVLDVSRNVAKSIATPYDVWKQ